MRILIHNGLWLSLFALLTACGQKGDLYLPQDQAIPTETQTSTQSRKEPN